MQLRHVFPGRATGIVAIGREPPRLSGLPALDFTLLQHVSVAWHALAPHTTTQAKTSHSSLMPLPLLRPPTHTHIHTTTHTLVQTIIPAAAPLLVEPPENRAGVPKSASSWWEKVVYSGEKAEDLKSFSLAGVPSAGGDWGPLFGCLPNLPSTQNAMRRWRIWQRSREAAAAAWGISPSRSRQAGNQKSTPLACWLVSLLV